MHPKRLILPLKKEIHDWFGLGRGNFWNPESGFPCWLRKIVLGDQVPERLPGVPGLRRTLHSGPSAPLHPRVGGATQPGEGGRLMAVKGALGNLGLVKNPMGGTR